MGDLGALNSRERQSAGLDHGDKSGQRNSLAENAEVSRYQQACQHGQTSQLNDKTTGLAEHCDCCAANAAAAKILLLVLCFKQAMVTAWGARVEHAFSLIKSGKQF
jgi:hypothetical protein